MRFQFSREIYFLFLFLSVLIYFPLFYDLGGQTVRLWDESRNAENAMEMSTNGNWIVTYFEGKPDMWNTKPPLLIWIQAILMKSFNYSNLAIRLPSAFAILGCILIFFWVSISNFKKIYLGAFFALIFISTPGIIRQHVSRTGDYDALLLFFVLSYSLLIFKYLEEDSEKNKNNYLIFFTIAAIGAGLTKGIAAFLIAPGILIYAISIRKFKFLITSPKFIVSLTIILVTILGYYFLREFYNPGYIKAVLSNEVTGRYMENQNYLNKPNDYFFYLRTFASELFTPWIFILPFCIGIIFLEKDNSIRRLGVFSTLIASSFLFIISYSKSKFGWYDAQFYPYACIVLSIGFNYIFTSFYSYLKIENKWKILIVFCAISIGIFFQNYEKIMYKIRTRGEIWNWRDEQYGGYLMGFDTIKYTNFSISFSETYNSQIVYYKNLLNRRGKNVHIKKPTELIYGDTVIFCYADKSEEYIDKNYNYENIFWGDCRTVRILSKK